MRILMINQYYWPDYAATAQMLADLCEHLAADGHEVHVLCSRGKYDDQSGTPRRSPRHEVRRGVHIHRVTATGFGKRSMLGRLADYLSFHLLIGLRMVLTGWRFDVVVTLTTPPLVGVSAMVARQLTLGRLRHVCWVMDLHPDCEFELGVFRRQAWGPRLLDWLNGLHFRCANRCVVLGEHMAGRLRDKGVAADRLRVIPVWGHDVQGGKAVEQGGDKEASTASDGGGGDGGGGGLSLRDELGLRGKFVVMYSGNAGLIHTFDEICEAARLLREDGRFVFLFVGGGPRLKEVRTFAEAHGLGHVMIHDYLPRERLGDSLATADVHLVTLREGMAGVAAPCKLYGVMAAGRPVVFVGPEACEPADAIRQANCGRTLPVGDAAGLAKALRAMADHPDEARRQGAAGRAAYERRYNASVCCEQWAAVLREVG